MRVFVTGATGALGRHLVPGLVAAGHEVTATTRTPGKAAQLREAGAQPVVLDGLEREAVIAAVRAASPEVIVHEMTALAGLSNLRNPDKAFAATNELRTRGTDNLLAAAAAAGGPVIATIDRPSPTTPVRAHHRASFMTSSFVRRCDEDRMCLRVPSGH